MRAIVSFGANLGEPVSKFLAVEAAIKSWPTTRQFVASELLRTPAVGGPSNQPPFVNGCYAFDTEFSADELLANLLLLEKELGRVRLDHWGPRTIDLDLLAFGSTVHATPTLVIPHPRLHYRPFAVLPAAAIEPEFVHPIFQLSFRELANRFAVPTPTVGCLGINADELDRLQARAQTLGVSPLRWVPLMEKASALLLGESIVAGVLEPSAPTVDWLLVGPLFTGKLLLWADERARGNHLVPACDARQWDGDHFLESLACAKLWSRVT